MKLRYRRLCEKKKREEIVRWTKEGQIWKIINRERKNRKRVTTRGKRRNRIDRKQISETMKRRGVREGLVRRCVEGDA